MNMGVGSEVVESTPALTGSGHGRVTRGTLTLARPFATLFAP